ncbi:hypothetical protein Cri9333_0128 [Crinalium epipsammum PCC 9333]|uniref:Uncharacterized protein n=1 Tax=Crinalium epipsammum PCC 9333 TaxID=1173022 RepID=K9VSU5_9CYAN|nr:hypothetical protein Cri9333_0128 [Crinalium epipsammum PCC 9333]
MISIKNLLSTLSTTFIAGSIALFTVSKAQSTSLTGLIIFSTDKSGSASGGQIFNTRGGRGDDFYNVWVQQNGKFINGLDEGNVPINISLDIPGVYTFKMYGEPTFEFGYFGLNLFFNGNNTKPGISVFAPINTLPASPITSFSVNSNANTLPLAGLAESAVPGAGTLCFVDKSTMVTLTSYKWSSSNVENIDLVSPFSAHPSGSNDFTGEFTLTVTKIR